MDAAPSLHAFGPRERLATVPITYLDDAELLALILGTGTRDEDVHALARRVLSELGTADQLARRSLAEVRAVRGLGEGKACRLAAALELGRRSLAEPVRVGRPLGSSRDVVAALRARLVPEEVEHFLVLTVDSRNRLVRLTTIAIGSVTYCPVAPADVLRAVIRDAAPAFLVAHNHPSGDPTPSPEDHELTRRLSAAAALLGLRLLDHVIVARGGAFSFLDAGVLPPGDGS